MKLILFDCDGTLVDSQHLIVEAMSRAFLGAGLAPLARQQVLAIVGLSLPLAIERLMPDYSSEKVKEVVHGYRDAFAELRRDPDHHEPLYDGMMDLILALSASDSQLLGVATGKSVRGVQGLFDRFNLHAHFATIQTADTNPSKPHPAMIETAMLETGVEPEDVVMIGDTTFDIEMAVNAGVKSIGVAWGYHPVGDLAASGAHEVVGDADDLSAAIMRSLT
ncbi:MAG: HAD-IA family hydrolase [Hyphomicrobiaceae bacterium]